MMMLEWKIKQISWNILSYRHLNEKKDILWRGRVPFQCITLNIDSVQYPHVDPGSNLNLIVFVIGIPNANSQHFNLRTLLHPTPTPIQQAALFKRQNMSQTVQVGSCHGYQLSCCTTTLHSMYNLSPKPVKNRKKACVSKKHFPDLWHHLKVSRAIACTYWATRIPTEWSNCSCKMSNPQKLRVDAMLKSCRSPLSMIQSNPVLLKLLIESWK